MARRASKGSNNKRWSGRFAEPVDALVNEIDQVDVFARVSPEHKVRIVEAFRKRGIATPLSRHEVRLIDGVLRPSA